MTDDGQKYRILYKVVILPEAISAEEVEKKKNCGACDCLLIASVLGQPGGPGPLSVEFASINGFKKESLNPLEEFNIWSMMAHHLIDRLPPGKHKEICKTTFEEVKGYVLSKRKPMA